jgi:adenylate cyclase
MKNTEIERKFLVTRLPQNLAKNPQKRLRQGYLTGGKEDVEVRIRDTNRTKFVLTVKGGRGLIRKEVEFQISLEQFESLWSIAKAKSLIKTRYAIPYGNLTLELDVYGGRHRGLKVAEVEFTTAAASKKFSPPSWFGKELTGDKRYSNQFLALS